MYCFLHRTILCFSVVTRPRLIMGFLFKCCNNKLLFLCVRYVSLLPRNNILSITPSEGSQITRNHTVFLTGSQYQIILWAGIAIKIWKMHLLKRDLESLLVWARMVNGVLGKISFSFILFVLHSKIVSALLHFLSSFKIDSAHLLDYSLSKRKATRNTLRVRVCYF